MAEERTADYQVGSMVRVTQVPPYLYLFADNPVNQETIAIFELCLGKVFRVQDFDEQGQLELWATEKGNPMKRFRMNSHTIWIEPEFVEPFLPVPSSAHELQEPITSP